MTPGSCDATRIRTTCLPVETAATTVDRRCGSAQQAVKAGLVTMCCGGGLGTATLSERI